MGNEPVEARRRRRATPPGGRAEAPRRDTGGAGTGGDAGGTGGTGGTGGFGGLGGLIPSRGRRGGCAGLPVGLVALLIIAYVAYTLLTGGGQETGVDTGQDAGFGDLFPTQEQILPTQPPAELPASNFTPPAPATGEGQNWLVMLYQDADDKILEQDIYVDLNEAERIGSSELVQVVAQIDRFRGGYTGDGNWTGARRYYITQDNDLRSVNSQVVQELGEVNMSDAQTLYDFVTWAVKTFPADKYALILSDHGMGWPGGWSDGDSAGSAGSSIPIASRIGDHIFTNELDQVLEEIRQDAGIDKFELIGMDACLMSQIEVLTALEPHARYAVLSEETEPSLGWAYASFLGALVENPQMDGRELSSLIVESYIEEDQRITDPQARADFLAQTSPMGGLFGAQSMSASSIVNQLAKNITLSAVDLSRVPALTERLNDFAYSLQGVDQGIVASARNYAQSYTSIFGNQVPASFIDLGHFGALVYKQTSDVNVQEKVRALLTEIDAAVVAEKHGAGKPGSTGIAIYFPNSTLYRLPVTGPQSYTGIASRFARQTLWDDFLGFHYSDRSFDQRSTEMVAPAESIITRAPGSGQVSVSNFTASDDSVEINETVKLSAEIGGTNIGHIYLFVGFYDSASNSLYVADMDYLESPQTREEGGVYYPNWSDQPSFTLTFEWEPIVFAINDGSKSVPALFTPQSYGATPDLATYTVEGVYTFADSGDQRQARLYFSDGKLRQVFGFTDGEAGAPREIIPQSGDMFSVYETWYEMDSSGAVSNTVKEVGETLTFGSDMFGWESLYAAAGQYVVGFLVADMDGNITPAYTQVEVR